MARSKWLDSQRWREAGKDFLITGILYLMVLWIVNRFWPELTRDGAIAFLYFQFGVIYARYFDSHEGDKNTKLPG